MGAFAYIARERKQKILRHVQGVLLYSYTYIHFFVYIYDFAKCFGKTSLSVCEREMEKRIARALDFNDLIFAMNDIAVFLPLSD